ncbi:hypothetical protein ACFSTD_02370 [Novosphingobium colocasiae]
MAQASHCSDDEIESGPLAGVVNLICFAAQLLPHQALQCPDITDFANRSLEVAFSDSNQICECIHRAFNFHHLTSQSSGGQYRRQLQFKALFWSKNKPLQACIA